MLHRSSLCNMGRGRPGGALAGAAWGRAASGGDPWAVSRRTSRAELCQEWTRAQAKGTAAWAKAPRSHLGSLFLEVRSGGGACGLRGPGLGRGAPTLCQGSAPCA